MNAVLPEGVMSTGRLKDDIVRPIKENVPTGRLRGGGENEGRKKTWLIGVQHLYPQGVIYHHYLPEALVRGKVLMNRAGRDVVIFVAAGGQS
jgi:hypothetical protein